LESQARLVSHIASRPRPPTEFLTV